MLITVQDHMLWLIKIVVKMILSIGLLQCGWLPQLWYFTCNIQVTCLWIRLFANEGSTHTQKYIRLTENRIIQRKLPTSDYLISTRVPRSTSSPAATNFKAFPDRTVPAFGRCPCCRQITLCKSSLAKSRQSAGPVSSSNCRFIQRGCTIMTSQTSTLDGLSNCKRLSLVMFED